MAQVDGVRRVAGRSHAPSCPIPPALEPALTHAAEDGPPLLVVSADVPAPAAVPVLRVHWANRAASELLGPDLQGLFAQPEPDGLAPTDWSARVAHAVTGPAVTAPEWRVATIDSSSATGSLLFRTSLVPATDDQPERHLVWLRSADEELAQAEQATADADFRFRMLGEHAPIGILMSEVGLRLAFANDIFADIANVPRSELLGTGWLKVFVPDDLAAIVDMTESVLAGTPATMTVRLRRADGLQRWALLKLIPVVTRSRAAGFVGTIEDVTTQLSRENELTYQASHDPLTGLANRRHLLATLTDLFERRRREDREFAVLFFDLDGFKPVNDNFGHDAGDRLLIEVARRMLATAREDDIVGRLAGDEFVIVLRHVASLDEARAAASRQLVELSREIRLGSAIVSVSASIGVALAHDHTSAEGILRAADESMYAQKRSTEADDDIRVIA